MTSASIVQIGARVAGRFRLDEVIGQGGMGTVYRATRLDSDELVALKVLRRCALRDGYEPYRLAREAHVGSLLRSPHVVRVHEAGVTDDGLPFIVMELLRGHSLERELARARPPIDSVVRWTLQCCEALDEGARFGLVHRDVKPANIFLTRSASGTETNAKLLDFGISKLSSSVGETDDTSAGGHTRSGVRLGTPRYMSPEQLRATARVDARADVWSMAVVVYEMLAGATPFTAPTEADLIVEILSGDPVPLEKHRPDLPAPLAAAVHKALSKDASARYPSAGEFAAALRAATVERPRTSHRRAGPWAASGLLAGTAALIALAAAWQWRANAPIPDASSSATARSRSPFGPAPSAVSSGPPTHATRLAPEELALPPTSPDAARGVPVNPPSSAAPAHRSLPAHPPRGGDRGAPRGEASPGASRFERSNPYD